MFRRPDLHLKNFSTSGSYGVPRKKATNSGKEPMSSGKKPRALEADWQPSVHGFPPFRFKEGVGIATAYPHPDFNHRHLRVRTILTPLTHHAAIPTRYSGWYRLHATGSKQGAKSDLFVLTADGTPILRGGFKKTTHLRRTHTICKS